MLEKAERIKFMKPNASWFFPALAKIFPVLEENGTKGLTGEPGDIKHFLSETIQQHKKTFTEDNIRDFIDAYLVQIKVQTYSYCFNFDVLLYTNIIF